MKLRNGRALAFGILQVFLLAFLLTMRKGIWADETLQFAPAAFPTLQGASTAIFGSIRGGLNHGQTGMHMLLNYASLRLLGASYLALRWPSYLAYAAGITSGFFFLMELGVSSLAGFAFAFCFGLSQLSLEHGWEARPYILLQGTVMSFLWAWSRYARGRKRALGWVLLSGALGILFHPFFVAYAGLFVVCSLVFNSSQRAALLQRWKKSRELIPALCGGITLIGIFLWLGSVSWFATQGRKFGLDPYEYVGHQKLLARFMVGTFFYPFSIAVIPILALLLVGFLRWRGDAEIKPLVPPFYAIFFVLVVTQGVITYSVVKSQYWILQRQWVAGNALAFLLAAILLDFLLKKIRFGQKLEARVSALVFVAELCFLTAAIRGNLSKPFAPSVPFENTAAFREKLEAQKEIAMSDYQALAHQNLLTGGLVWPVFQRLYGGSGQK